MVSKNATPVLNWSRAESWSVFYVFLSFYLTSFVRSFGCFFFLLCFSVSLFALWSFKYSMKELFTVFPLYGIAASRWLMIVFSLLASIIYQLCIFEFIFKLKYMYISHCIFQLHNAACNLTFAVQISFIWRTRTGSFVGDITWETVFRETFMKGESTMMDCKLQVLSDGHT